MGDSERNGTYLVSPVGEIRSVIRHTDALRVQRADERHLRDNAVFGLTTSTGRVHHREASQVATRGVAGVGGADAALVEV